MVNRGLDEDSDTKDEASIAEPEFEVVPTTSPSKPPSNIPLVSQEDKLADTPDTNTRAQRRLRTLQDEANANLEATMVLIEAGGKPTKASILKQALATKLDVAGAAIEVSARRAASRRYPLQFLCDLANAVLDGDTGEMLEYRHLITRPKYKEVWGDA